MNKDLGYRPGGCQRPRLFIGLQAELASVPAERLQWLVSQAWHEQAPKKLAAAHDRSAAHSQERDA